MTLGNNETRSRKKKRNRAALKSGKPKGPGKPFDSSDGSELMLWERKDDERLFELYRAATGGPYFARLTDRSGAREWKMENSRAESILSRASFKRAKDIPNERLRNGYCVTVDDKTYDTRLDKVVFVGVGDRQDAAVIYETRSGELYVHLIEHGVDEVFIVYESLSSMIALIDFRYNPKSSIFDCLNRMQL